MPRPPKQVGNLTFEQKKRICEWRDDDPSLSQRQLAERAKRELVLLKAPAQGTISNILRQKQKFLRVKGADLTSKRTRQLAFPAVDEALANWVLQCQAKRVSLNGDMIKEKARRVASLAGVQDDQMLPFSNGWLQAFQARHGFKQLRIHGESGAVQVEELPALREGIRDQLKGIALADIYNMDETGLFYCLAPDKTIARRQVLGSKKSKVRVTVALTCNADGSDKREPFIIGHAKKPRCFKKKTGDQLGFYYRNNKKAWMTAVLFQEWLHEFDVSMQAQRRDVVLLVDNASAHIAGNMDLQNVTVVFLPPNTTSRLQPLDAGIIASFKRRYRHRQLQHALDMEEEGTVANIYAVDQLTAMKWIKACWRNVPSEGILNCFRHTGIVPGRTTTRRARKEADEMLKNALLEQMGRLRIRDPMAVDEFVCNAVDDAAEMEEFTAEDLLSDAANAAFLDSAQDDIEEEEATDAEEGCCPLEGMSTVSKVDAIRATILLLADHPDVEARVSSGLRTVQHRLRQELREQREASLVQTSIMGFFSELGSS